MSLRGLMNGIINSLKDEEKKMNIAAKINLPPLADQNLKFSHFRYKIIPFLDNPKERAEFFKEIRLPVHECFNSDGEFAEVAIFPWGGMTAAYKINPETGNASIGISKCNIMDPYNKRHGRVISSGRYGKVGDELTHINHFEKAVIVDISETVCDELPPHEAVREFLIDEFNSGEVRSVERDMATIRAIVASHTKNAFCVELS